MLEGLPQTYDPVVEELLGEITGKRIWSFLYGTKVYTAEPTRPCVALHPLPELTQQSITASQTLGIVPVFFTIIEMQRGPGQYIEPHN